LENYFALASRFSGQSSVRFIFSVGPDEEAISTSGRGAMNTLFVRLNDVGRLAALMARAQVFISSDTGPSHIATLLGMRGLVLISGKTCVNLWYRANSTLELLQHRIPACETCEPEKRPRCNCSCVALFDVGKIEERVNELLKQGDSC
jgi:ADP-heptose:LPS heptosyltransferase